MNPDVMDAATVSRMLHEAEDNATLALEALHAAEESGIGDLAVLGARQQFANGMAEGLARALGALLHQPPAMLRIRAIARTNENARRRDPIAEAASPEKPEPAAIVDAGSGGRGGENGVEGARPVGDGRARAGLGMPRCLP